MTIIQADGLGTWFLHLIVDKISHRFSYDVDYEKTSFYNPDKDNTLLDGGIFSTIKYRLGTKENGILTKTQIEKMYDMFSISIGYSGIGNAIRSTVRFDTNYLDAIGFHDRLKEELSKQFTVIKQDISLAERIPVHILSPAIMIENNDKYNVIIICDSVNIYELEEDYD